MNEYVSIKGIKNMSVVLDKRREELKEIEDKLEELASMYGRKAEELKENEELIIIMR